MKLKAVAATGVIVDSYFGDDAAKNISACMPISIITGGAGYNYVDQCWLTYKHVSISYRNLSNKINYCTYTITRYCIPMSLVAG